MLKERYREDYDVVVCGGGPAGIGAAIGAAKSGARTLIIEKCGNLGGVGVSSLLCLLMPGETDHKRNVIKGIYLEIVDILQQKNAIFVTEYGSPFDPEIAKVVFDELMEKYNVEILYHSMVTDVIRNDNEIESVIIENKSGRSQVDGKVFIDATGDGDIAERANLSWFKGDERGLMPVTTIYTVQNVNMKYFINHYKERIKDNIVVYDDLGEVVNAVIYGFEKEEVARAIINGDYSIPRETMCGIWMLPNHHGEVYVHATRVPNVDPTDAVQLSKAIVAGRKQVVESHNFMKKYIKGFEETFITKIAPQIGVRQSRQVIGDYIITGQDLMGCRQFDDVIAQGTYGTDVHSSKAAGDRIEKIGPGMHYDIPYRAIVAKGIDNLLTSGRCISAEVDAMSGFRVMPISMAIGQGAGAAAGLCSQKECTTRELRYEILRTELISQGVCLE